jgi:hypothetical protein
MRAAARSGASRREAASSTAGGAQPAVSADPKGITIPEVSGSYGLTSVASYAENMLSSIERARADAVRLSAGSYSSRDMEKLVEDIGADLELFLKTAVYGGAGRSGIAKCISGLTRFGIRQADIDALDRLRLAYNHAKHQPGTALTFEETDTLLQDTATAVSALTAASVANVNVAEPVQTVRQFWLIAGDHITGGETEVDICLPMPEVDFPPALDVVNIEMAAWPLAHQDLAAAGELREGLGSVPDRIFQSWTRETDVVLIGSWTGQYRDLLRALLPHEKVLDVLPGLARGDDFTGTLAALLMAAVDLGQDSLLTGSKNDMRAELLAYAETAYSIPSSKPAASRAADIASGALGVLSELQRLELSGPFWRSREDIAALRPSARAVARDDLFVIVNDGRLIAWNGH